MMDTDLILSWGGGTNSTALLIGLRDREIKPVHILFADTGGERPETYEHMDVMNNWLKDNKFPQITVVSEKQTLEQDCLNRNALPGIAYGFKSCSEHFKIRPQKRWVKANKIASVKWIVGIDADEAHRATDELVWYPLIEWDWGRDECKAIIKKEGMAQPGKSSCFFCPSMRKTEIKLLNYQHPELIERAIEMENNAELTSIKGLGRSYSWEKLLSTDDMFEDEFKNIDPPCGCYDG